MKKIPWFKFDPIDFMDDENVKMMCDEAIGLYIRILCHSWTHDSIPADDESIMALFKLSKHKFKKLWPKIKKCFYLENERFFNNRLSKELQEAKNNFIRNSENGKKGAEKVWGGHRKAIGGANAVANGESMQDSDSDSDLDLDKSSVNSNDIGASVRTETEPNNKISKYSPKTGILISKAINAHRDVFEGDVMDNSLKVKRLFLELLRVPGIDSERQRVLAYLIQAKTATKSKPLRDRLGYAISIIKSPKYAPADASMQTAKELLNQWTGESNGGKKLAQLAPDFTISENS